VWAADVPASADRYVALFNRDATPGNVTVDLADLGIDSATVTDLWSGAAAGTATGTLTRSIPGHGAALLRLTPGTTVPPPPAHRSAADDRR
jgi:hypothetical protein